MINENTKELEYTESIKAPGWKLNRRVKKPEGITTRQRGMCIAVDGAYSTEGLSEINRVVKQSKDLAQSKLLIIQRIGSHR